MSADIDPEASFNGAPGDMFMASPDSPTDAHRVMLALLHDTVVEAARRRQEELPGLVETLQDDVVLTMGGTRRAAYGWFAESVWRYGDRHVHELFLNADRRLPHQSMSGAEDVLVTLLHEACHAWAQANGIKDTSRDGRYHNRRFTEIAVAIGLVVEKDASIGHRTSGLLPWARTNYSDLLDRLERGLILVRDPRSSRPVGTSDADDENTDSAESIGSAATLAKYVFASCRCLDARGHLVTIRVAKGSWRQGVICCSVCQARFAEPLTVRRQDVRQ
ncbi:MAG: hypothetical protein ACRDSL_03490 [Pseudonocardiaceae bacterium]